MILLIIKENVFKTSHHTTRPALVLFNLISFVPVSHSVIETNTMQEGLLIYVSENDLTALQAASELFTSICQQRRWKIKQIRKLEQVKTSCRKSANLPSGSSPPL